MKVILVAVIVIAVGLGPGAYLARRTPKSDDGSRLWLGQVTVVVLSLAWVAALVFIAKEVF